MIFNVLYGDDLCRCPFPCCLFGAIFQAPVYDKQSNEEDDGELFNIILFFYVVLCQVSFRTINCLPQYESDMFSGVFLNEKKRHALYAWSSKVYETLIDLLPLLP